ncbi:hypothetical protein CC2G_013299 [Coprinopsis cinerea AmutBmut pab1-1]|nr:hypothetical protein CC2G_013299 [Coprinopsis cinerea AmutBmut pab1-1]
MCISFQDLIIASRRRIKFIKAPAMTSVVPLLHETLTKPLLWLKLPASPIAVYSMYSTSDLLHNGDAARVSFCWVTASSSFPEDRTSNRSVAFGASHPKLFATRRKHGFHVD